MQINKTKLKSFKTIFLVVIVTSLISSKCNDIELIFYKNIKSVFKYDEIDVIPLEIDESFDLNINFFELKIKDSLIGYSSISIANACPKNGCSINNGINTDFETFTFQTIYNVLKKVVKVRILDYDSEYGYQIASHHWLKQFYSNNNEEYIINKNIDGISGATTSVKSIVENINIQKKIFLKIK